MADAKLFSDVFGPDPETVKEAIYQQELDDYKKAPLIARIKGSFMSRDNEAPDPRVVRAEEAQRVRRLAAENVTAASAADPEMYLDVVTRTAIMENNTDVALRAALLKRNLSVQRQETEAKTLTAKAHWLAAVAANTKADKDPAAKRAFKPGTAGPRELQGAATYLQSDPEMASVLENAERTDKGLVDPSFGALAQKVATRAMGIRTAAAQNGEVLDESDAYDQAWQETRKGVALYPGKDVKFYDLGAAFGSGPYRDRYSKVYFSPGEVDKAHNEGVFGTAGSKEAKDTADALKAQFSPKAASNEPKVYPNRDAVIEAFKRGEFGDPNTQAAREAAKNAKIKP